jgi:hypothetical protein
VCLGALCRVGVFDVKSRSLIQCDISNVVSGGLWFGNKKAISIFEGRKFLLFSNSRWLGCEENKITINSSTIMFKIFSFHFPCTLYVDKIFMPIFWGRYKKLN